MNRNYIYILYINGGNLEKSYIFFFNFYKKKVFVVCFVLFVERVLGIWIVVKLFENNGLLLFIFFIWICRLKLVYCVLLVGLLFDVWIISLCRGDVLWFRDEVNVIILEELLIINVLLLLLL